MLLAALLESNVEASPNMSDENTDKLLGILLDEYKRSSSYTHQMEGQLEKIAAIWIAVIAVIFGIGLKENIPVIFLLLPVLIFLVLLYTICFFEVVVIAGGYTASIEVRINGLIGASVLYWESRIVSQISHLRASIWILLIVGLTSAVGIIIYSAHRCFYYYPKLFWVQLGFVCITFSVVVWLFVRLPSLHKKVSQIATQIYAEQFYHLSITAV